MHRDTQTPSASAGPLAKGTVFLNVRDFVAARFGAGAWAQLLASLPADAQGTLSSALATGWYPSRYQPILYRGMDATLGKGDQTLVDQLATFSARADISGVYRAFFRAVTPNFILDQGMRYWRRFQNTGSWRVERLAPNRALAVLHAFQVTDPVVCRYLRGYMHQMMAFSGAQDLSVEHTQCCAMGAADCRFLGHWRAS